LGDPAEVVDTLTAGTGSGILARVRRFASIAVLALVFCAAALADAPSSVKVTMGTLLHGDAASLGSIDGNTLDIRAAKKDANKRAHPWVLKLKALYGQRQAGTLTVRYSFWPDAEVPNGCYFWATLNGARISDNVVEYRPDGVRNGQFQATASTAGNVAVRVWCTGRPDQFTVHFDLLALDGSP
jgi:hypothetical protein